MRLPRPVIHGVAVLLAVADLGGLYLAYLHRPEEVAAPAEPGRPAAPAASVPEPPPPPAAGPEPPPAAPEASAQAPPETPVEAPAAPVEPPPPAPAPQAPVSPRPHPPAVAAAPSLRERAVQRARAGDTAGALAMLEPALAQAPGDLPLARDTLAVLGWAGHPAEVAALYQRLPPDEPAYVLDAAAHANRDLKRWPEALALYQEGMRRFPDETGFTAGAILVLTDMGKPEEALDAVDEALGRKATLPVLLAAAYAALALGHAVDALRWCDQALELEPENKEALRDRILATERMGAPHLALALAKSAPGLVSESELRRIEGSDAAELVRFDPLEAPSESQRFAAADAAIARLDALIAAYEAAGAPARDNLLRARLDRIIAYHDRVRMTDAVREYEALTAAKADVPGYVLDNVAGAYLYLREPEIARALYERVLKDDPRSFSAGIGLFYSLVELEAFDEALPLIDKLDQAQPIWIKLKGPAALLPNPARETADLAAANARLYANDLAAAEEKVTALATAAPANASFRMSLGNVYGARGWPRRAKEEYEIAAGIAPSDADLGIARGDNALALKDYPAAEALASDLPARFPERRDAERLAEQWEIHNRPELTLSVGKTFESQTSIQGGNGTAVDATFYSQPIAYHWRGFIGDYLADQRVILGPETYFRQSAGLEWRGPDLTLAGSASYNSYGGAKPGAAIKGAYALDDQWQLEGRGEIFAKDTPLAALKAGITADAAGGTVSWRESESRSASLSGTFFSFSDGNARPAFDGRWTERLWTEPHLFVDASADLAGSASSRSGRPYYSPSHDLLPSLGVAVSQVLYRRYELKWDHELQLRSGGYWEQDFGTSFAGVASYRHRLRTSEAFEIAAGLSLGRQTYDGQRVDSLALTLDLVWRPEL